MKKTWLASASTLALGVALSAPVMAACDEGIPGVVVCEDDDLDGVVVNAVGDVDIDVLDGATITNLGGDAIKVDATGDVFFNAALDAAISATGNGVRISAGGDITIASGAKIEAGSIGILSSVGDNDNDITITNSGEIYATNSHGIDSRVGKASNIGDGDITVTNGAAIKAADRGINSLITGSGKIKVVNSEKVETSGQGIHSNIDGEGAIIVRNSGDIYATSDGIYSAVDGNDGADSGAIKIVNSGDIYAIGSNADGIDSAVEGDGTIIIKNSGAIDAGGTGISSDVRGDGTIKVVNSKKIDAGGYGIYSYVDAGTIIARNSGEISADREGIYSEVGADGKIKVVSSEKIDASFDGIFSKIYGSGDIIVKNRGVINAGFDGISSSVAGDDGGTITVTNNGAIDAADRGIYSEVGADGAIKVVNSKKIEAGFHGIYSKIGGDGTIIVRNSGAIDAGGDDAGGDGIYSGVGGDGKIRVVNSKKIEAYGSGIHSWIIGSGDISIRNSDAINAADNDGIFSEIGGGNITVRNSKKIEAGDNGIFSIVGSGKIKVVNSGAINAAISDGIRSQIVDGDGDITVRNSKKIEAGSAGIYSQIGGDGAITVRNSGEIYAVGSGSYGIYSDIDGGGAIKVVNNKKIEAGVGGIYSEIGGDGAITVRNSSDIYAIGSGSSGIYSDIDGGGAIKVVNSGAIGADYFGILSIVGNEDDITAETGNINVTNSGAIDAGDGIHSLVYGDGAITVRNSATINARVDGILSIVDSGKIKVVNSGAINAAGGDGIYSQIFRDGDITVRNSGEIYATGSDSDGIYSLIGGGNITVRNSSAIDTNRDGIGSFINRFGDLKIRNSGAITAGRFGIYSHIFDDGNITVRNIAAIDVDHTAIFSVIGVAGNLKVTNSGAINAGNYGIHSIVGNEGDITNEKSNITVTNSGAIDSGSDGIHSLIIGGDGDITVRNSGVIDAHDDGIYSRVFPDGDITVRNSDAITAGLNGILSLVDGEGDITIVNAVSESQAGLIQGDLAIDAKASNGSVEIRNDGTIQTNLAATSNPDAVVQRVVKVEAGDDILFRNRGLLIGNVKLIAGNGATLNNSNIWNVSGNNEFDGASDVVRNTGRINASGATSFVGLENFRNVGGVLNMHDVDGDFGTTNTDGTFRGGINSLLAIDAKLGNESGLGLADLLTAGTFRNQTSVAVNDLLADVPAGYNPKGVIFASYANDTDDDAFVLANGPIDKGLFSFDVFHDEDHRNWVLANAPDSTFFELPSIVTGAQQLWHDTAGVWLDRTADLRAAMADPCSGGLKEAVCSTSSVTPGLWAKVVGATTQRSQQQQNFALLNQNLTFNIGYDQNSTGIIGGFDTGEQDGNGAWIAGVFGGYVVSDLEFDNSTTSVDYRAGLVGGYASYLEGGFFTDARVIAQFGLADYKSISGIIAENAQTDFVSLGGTLEAGYRIPMGDGLFIEPGASLTYVNSNLDDLAIFGEAAEFGSGESLRGRLGARIGGSFIADTVKIEPFVGLSVLREYRDENVASVASNGFRLEASDDIGQTFGEMSVGINVLDLGDTGLSGFVKGNAQFGENDFENYTGNVGFRLKF